MNLSAVHHRCAFTDCYAAGQEEFLGTLEPGKFADLVVIDRDIYTIPEEEILNIQVENTYLAGKEVYNRLKGAQKT